MHAPGVPFVCLTDGDGLLFDWPGWWAKMEIFRLHGPVLYMDLDMTVRADLTPLLDAVAKHEFIALRDFNPQTRETCSALMGWSGDMSPLLARFADDPEAAMASCKTPRWWGDQGFIERHGPAPVCWQDILPGAAVSYKKHCRAGVPEGVRVVCYHGKPRPWEVE